MKEFLGFNCNRIKQENGYERIYCDVYSQPYEKHQNYRDAFREAVANKYKLRLPSGEVELYLKSSRDKFSLAAKKLEKDNQALQSELSAAQKEYEREIAPFLEKLKKKKGEIFLSYKDKLAIEEQLIKQCPHKDIALVERYYQGEFVSSNGVTDCTEYCLFCKKKIREYSR